MNSAQLRVIHKILDYFYNNPRQYFNRNQIAINLELNENTLERYLRWIYDNELVDCDINGYRSNAKGDRYVRVDKLLNEANNLENIERLNEATIRAANATARLSENQILHNSNSNEISIKIRNLTRATVFFIFLQTLVFIGQLHFMQKSDHREAKKESNTTKEDNTPQQWIIVYPKSGHQDTLKIPMQTDTVYIKKTP